jgi:hypothetical protein
MVCPFKAEDDIKSNLDNYIIEQRFRYNDYDLNIMKKSINQLLISNKITDNITIINLIDKMVNPDVEKL